MSFIALVDWDYTNELQPVRYEDAIVDDDDDVVIDLDFPTPQTPEEARKEIEEIEEEIRQGKCMTLDEFIAHTNQKLNKYESYFV